MEKSKLIDTHCHLDIVESKGLKIEDSLKNAIDSGIEKIIQIGIDYDSSIRAKKISENYSNDKLIIHYTIGCHPTEKSEFKKVEDIFGLIKKNIADPKFVGIGEIGIDTFHEKDSFNLQIEVLEKIFDFTEKIKLPVVIHSRDCAEETLNFLKKYRDKVYGVIHCFTYDYNYAKKFIDCGYYISFSGILTFKNAKDIQDTARKIPLETILIETDAPFLAPDPFRGKRNESSYTSYVMEKMFSLREEKNKMVSDIIYSNSNKFINRKAYFHA